MASVNQIKDVLKQLQPHEVIDMCELYEDAEVLTEVLDDYIEDNAKMIQGNLIANGLMEEAD